VDIVPETDAFSIGCILAEMLVKQPLFEAVESGPEYLFLRSIQLQAVLGSFNEQFRGTLLDMYNAAVREGLAAERTPAFEVRLLAVLRTCVSLRVRGFA
jgi:hypothetical protein